MHTTAVCLSCSNCHKRAKQITLLQARLRVLEAEHEQLSKQKSEQETKDNEIIEELEKENDELKEALLQTQRVIELLCYVGNRMFQINQLDLSGHYKHPLRSNHTHYNRH